MQLYIPRGNDPIKSYKLVEDVLRGKQLDFEK